MAYLPRSDHKFQDLLNSQKLEIRAAIRNAGFEFSEFQLGRLESEKMQYWLMPVIVHARTNSIFGFDFVLEEGSDSRRLYSVRTPGRESATETIQARDWPERMSQVKEWLQIIKRELNPASHQIPPGDSAERISQHQSNGRTDQTDIAIFISHSSTDAKMAKTLADVLSKALSLPPDKIRCTSALSYSLPYGSRTTETLRQEVAGAGVAIGLITPSSVESYWVLFELGARWGQGKPLFSVLAGGPSTSPEILPDPIRDLHALTEITISAVVKFVEEVADVLGVKPLALWQYSDLVDLFVAAAQRVTATTVRRTESGAEYEDESFLHGGLEWILTPQFFKSYKSVMPADAEPANYLNTLIRGPFCHECKRDADASVRKGNRCLFCKGQYSVWEHGALSMPPMVGDVGNWKMYELKLKVYVEAQAAARRRELKQH